MLTQPYDRELLLPSEEAPSILPQPLRPEQRLSKIIEILKVQSKSPVKLNNRGICHVMVPT